LDEVNSQVDILENELKQQLKSNEVLLMTLKNIRQQIIKTGKDIKHILAENPSALSLDRAISINNVSNFTDCFAYCQIIIDDLTVFVVNKFLFDIISNFVSYYIKFFSNYQISYTFRIR
jgi:hypothetical protein